MKELRAGGHPKAPSFSLTDKDGKRYSLAALNDEYVVLYFYPKDNTSGCTTEARMFNRDRAKFARLRARVVGISGGDEMSKAKFCAANNLRILLLSDTDFAVARAYKSYGKKKFMGRAYTGIFRKTFVLDRNRRIVKVFDRVKPDIHSGEVLQYLSSLQAERRTTKGASKSARASRPAQRTNRPKPGRSALNVRKRKQA